MELREHTPVFRAYAHRMHRQPPLFLVRSPRRFCHARQPGRLVGKLGRLVGMRVQGNQTIIVDACAARRGRFPPALDLDVHSRGGDPLASPSVHLTTTSLSLSLTRAHALLFSFSLAPDPAYHGFSAPLFLLLFPRECPVREPSASRFQEDSNREPIGLVGFEYLIGV